MTERILNCVYLGKADSGVEYLGGHDGDGFKTFRTDRILYFAESLRGNIEVDRLMAEEEPSAGATL